MIWLLWRDRKLYLALNLPCMVAQAFHFPWRPALPLNLFILPSCTHCFPSSFSLLVCCTIAISLQVSSHKRSILFASKGIFHPESQSLRYLVTNRLCFELLRVSDCVQQQRNLHEVHLVCTASRSPCFELAASWSSTYMQKIESQTQQPPNGFQI